MIGTLNRRARLMARVLAPDGGGGFSESWQCFAIVWASLQPASGTDEFGPDVFESRTRYRVTLRRRGDLVAGQRVAIGRRCFRVHNILDAGRPAETVTLLCEERP